MFWIVYIALVSLQLYFIFNEQELWLMITKALLMPTLLLIIYTHSKLASKPYKVLFLAIFLGWLGDLFLMFEGITNFTLGFSSFFLGHIAYIYLFSKDVSNKRQTHYITERPYWILPYIAIIVFSIINLWGTTAPFPGLPVYLYTFTIALMSLFTVNRKYAADRLSWGLIIVGSLLFIVSDYALSIRLFSSGFQYDKLFVIATYTAAQGLIVYGYLNNKVTSAESSL